MKKLNVGSALAAPPKKSEHQRVTVGERLGALLGQFVTVNPQYKKLKAQHETLSRDIGAETRLLYFDTFAGRAPQSSTMLVDVDGREVKLLVKDQYSQSLTDDAPLIEAIGQELVEKHFHWRTKYTVDFDQIPEDKQEGFAAAIEKARVELKLADSALVAKQFIEPTAGFHDARTILLTPEQNRQLDAVLPVRSNPLL